MAPSLRQGQNGPRPITETGIKLHAASGKVSVQAQTDKADVNAQKDVSVQSTAASVCWRVRLSINC